MRNKTVIVCAVICGVLFISAAVLVILQFADKTGEGIIITLDGVKIYEGAGTHTGETLYIDAQGKYGINHIRIDETGVCVESAGCPNGECVAMGYLKNRYLPIVCLPNKLEIQYAGALAEDELDAISQ